MNPVVFRKPDFFTKSVYGGSIGALAGLTTSAVVDTGVAIDKQTVATGKRFEGVLLTLPVEVILDSGQSQSVALVLQHSDASSSGFATLASETTTVTNATTSTGVTSRAVAKVAANCFSAKQWLRGRVSFTGSAADTGGDQTASAMTLTFFGPSESPATG